MTTSPLPRHSSIGEISPFDDNSLPVFKIQANDEYKHKGDRIAFMRIRSGKFEAAHGGEPCAGRKVKDLSDTAAADDGIRANNRRRGICRRHHWCI